MQGDKDETANAVADEEMILMTTQANKIEKHTWIADSGATTHMTNSVEGMKNLKTVEQNVSVGDGRASCHKRRVP